MASHQQIFAELEKRYIHKKVLHAGVGDLPNFVDGSKVTFHYRTTKCDDDRTILDDSKKINKPLELIIGKKFKLEVWETLIKTMKVKETAEFLVTDIKDTAVYPMVAKSLRDINKGHHNHTGHQCCGMMAEGGTGYEDLNELMKKPSPLLFTLELIKFESPEDFEKETWTMDTNEKLAVIPKLKEEGNKLYKEKKYDAAIGKYEQALGLLEQLLTLEKPGDPEWVELDKKKIPLLLNYSQCKLLTEDYYTAITHTTDVLKKDYASEADRVKALFRRGKAHAAVWDVKEAKEDLQKAAELDPSLSKAVAKEIKLMEERVSEKEQQEKAKLRGMFG
ncbi:hypothetical protein BaRGS_00023388 [Batillaria attramentaria]|uniref:AIP/AIPL N-terminal FKBP-type PPIase domain-containing protein n=1 Tax=Batillaria attramentaria TaxID=370345 RepID=A0ABD0KEG8_9CAEN